MGFSFDGVHSSRLGIVRVSNSDRYSEYLQPDFEDKILPIPGNDGQYYYGSDYREKRFSLSIAFDSMTEEQFRIMTRLFSTKKPCPLIFDERPYKMYTAKLASPIQLEYVCFDQPIETDNGPNPIARLLDDYKGTANSGYRLKNTSKKYRVYKGEGTIEFLCTSIYARAPFKTLDQYLSGGYPITKYTNVDEWAAASGILTSETYNEWKVDVPRTPTEYGTIKWKSQITVYNPGDVDSPFRLYLPFSSGIIKGGDGNNLRLRIGNEWMYFDPITRKDSDDTGIVINTENHLIEGVNRSKEGNVSICTGTVYNQYLVAGDFPKILHQDLFLDEVQISASSIRERPKQIILIDYNGAASGPAIEYDYLYY